MEYFTSDSQERILHDAYLQRWREEQDRVRERKYRLQRAPSPIQEPDRIFFVEPDGRVYLGEVREDRICPSSLPPYGRSYGIDSAYERDVAEFIQRHPRYMVVFSLVPGYSRQAGIHPAQMVADGEELTMMLMDV